MLNLPGGNSMRPASSGLAINTVENALNLDGLGVLRWGGNLTQNTTVNATAAGYDVTFANSTFGTPTILHLDGGTGFVGIRTNTPATQFNNQSATTTQTDGTIAIAGAGLGWTSAGAAGYAAVVSNSLNNLYGYGLLIRSSSTDANSNLLNILGSDTAVQALIVKGDGKVGLGVAAPASKLNTEAVLQVDGLGVGLKTDGFGFTSNSDTTGYAAAIINNAVGAVANSSGGLLIRSGTSVAADGYILRVEDFINQPVLAVTEVASVGILTDSPSSLLANTSNVIADNVGTNSQGYGLSWYQASTGNYAAGFGGLGHGVLVSSSQTTSTYKLLKVMSGGTANTVLVARADNRVGVGSETFDVPNPEKLLVNAGTDASVNVISAYADFNSYRQLNIKNINAGASASTDLVATANTGSETTNFVNVGINSSAYSDAAFASGALDAYLYNNGGNLYIGTATAAKGVIFHVAGTLAANQAGYIASTGRWGIGQGANTPFALLTNTNTSFSDGTRSVYAAGGLGWTSAEAAAGFVGGFYNSSNTTGAGALLARVTSTNAATYGLHVVVGASTTVLSVAGNSRVGVLTATPASAFNNFATIQTDGTTALSTSGMGWSVASGVGYVAAFVHGDATANANGVLITTTATSGFGLRIRTNSAQTFAVGNNGRISIGGSTAGSLLNTSASLATQSDGTTSLGTNGFGWEQSQANYIGAFVNLSNAANSNGLLVRVARNATDASALRVLYGGTSVAMMVRADGRVGINTATPAAPLDVNPTFAASTAIAQFGGAAAASVVSINYGGTNDFSNIKIGTNFTLSRNGGSNPSISTSAMVEVQATALYVMPPSGNSGTINLQAINPGSGGRGRIGAYNTANSTMNIGNTYDGGSGEFFYQQATIFRNGRVLVADTNTETFDANAILELNSTTRALLIPRMTTVQKNAITATNGMMVYDATTNKFCGYAGGAWVDLH